MTNHLMIQQSISMKIFRIFFIFIVFIKICYSTNSSCLSCSSHLCYQCYNRLPIDRTNIEKLHIICNITNSLFQHEERFYSIIKSYTTINCSMKTFYLDQYTLWNYLEYMSITYANLSNISPIIFNRSLSLLSPILYSIKTLNLSHNSIRIINKNFSYYFPSLEKLDLSYNRLIIIRKKTFTNLLYLKELYLNNNYLKTILPNIFPHQSFNIINLNMNYWYCSCTNILILSISRPIPNCHTPNEFQYQNISNIAQQCLLRTKANILINTNMHNNQNLTCVLSSIIDEWKDKINKNITLLSAWHIEQHESISLENLFILSNNSDKYLICFDFQSIHRESIYTIINLTSIISLQSSFISINFTKFNIQNSTLITSTIINITSSNKLSPIFLWLFNTSKNILPKYFQTSNKHILIIWLILVIIALFIFIFLIYFIYNHKKKPYNYQTSLNVKFTCQNHKCQSLYNRRAHSKLYLTKSTSLNLLDKQINFIRPSYITSNQLRYAKIKQIPSLKNINNNYLTGEFRTIVKLKTLPN
ncbi:unnamed protein product [Rotaria sp. Silwood1]|nr:unnamed protein product [Rotaria sp. Silwood1]CAF3656076.1 unnamed protein product [Rotaria sp. Silwood1]CAF3667121.1 unnamed protein product [Rotaria sp. Silwood1]CAF3680593.1 unnamed protein product [Rotaria sp. Silwood1]CAF4560595.1 unnamed protein product [Rotaria sp. Silwood1]